MQLLYCRARLFVSCIFYHGYYSKSFANVSERRLHARLNIARHFFYTRTRVPHARHACLVLDFSEPNCDWSKKNYVMEIVCGFVFADVIFRRSEATAGNTSAFAGYLVHEKVTVFGLRAFYKHGDWNEFCDLFRWQISFRLPR